MKQILIVGDTPYLLQRCDFSLFAGAVLRDPLRIVVHDTHDRCTADETLLHELFHCCEKELVRTGVLKEESPENYVEAITTLLYQTLRRNNLWQHSVEWEQLNLWNPLEKENNK